MRILSFARLTAAAILLYGCNDGKSVQESPVFDKVIVDRNGPTDPWGKATGDINGDGKPDLIVGGHGGRIRLSAHCRNCPVADAQKPPC